MIYDLDLRSHTRYHEIECSVGQMVQQLECRQTDDTQMDIHTYGSYLCEPITEGCTFVQKYWCVARQMVVGCAMDEIDRQLLLEAMPMWIRKLHPTSQFCILRVHSHPTSTQITTFAPHEDTARGYPQEARQTDRQKLRKDRFYYLNCSLMFALQNLC